MWKWPLWLALDLHRDLPLRRSGLSRRQSRQSARRRMGAPSSSPPCAMVVMWTWVRGNALLVRKTQRDSIRTVDLIRMLEKSKPVRVAGTAIFLTNHPDTRTFVADAQPQAQQGAARARRGHVGQDRADASRPRLEALRDRIRSRPISPSHRAALRLHGEPANPLGTRVRCASRG